MLNCLIRVYGLGISSINSRWEYLIIASNVILGIDHCQIGKDVVIITIAKEKEIIFHVFIIQNKFTL